MANGGAWRPTIGERVVLVTTGEVGTVRQLAPTEWGLLCDVEFDAGRPGDALRHPTARRRVHAEHELRPAAG